MTTTAHTTAVRITFPTGEVEYRTGVVASEIVREMRAAGHPCGTGAPGEVKIAPFPIEKIPVTAGGTFTGEMKVGEFVTVTHIGVAKTGRIVKVGRTRVTVAIVVYAGTTKERTKEITVAKTEVR